MSIFPQSTPEGLMIILMRDIPLIQRAIRLMAMKMALTWPHPQDADDQGITSGNVYLTLSEEPALADNNGLDSDNDPNSNLTIDFGFLQYDFGDDPDIYGTSLTVTATAPTGGARHVLDGVTYLGSRVDPEWDGLPTDTSFGDDDDGSPDDEDGVRFLTPIMPWPGVSDRGHGRIYRLPERLDRL